jgi:hypothetical protein
MERGRGTRDSGDGEEEAFAGEDEHPDTLRSMSNLAATYKNQSKWKEAEALEMAMLKSNQA